MHRWFYPWSILSDNPCEDQIFNIEGVTIQTDLNDWLLAIQKDEVLSKIRGWVLENKILEKKDKENLQGREKILAKMLPHLKADNGILIFKQPIPGNNFI